MNRRDTATALDATLEAAVQSRRLPALAAIATIRGETAYEGAFGWKDFDGGSAMTVDTLLRIASMTKLLTSIAAMQLVERGALDLDVRVARILPAFDDLKVLTGFDGDEPILARPRSQATVRQLLTHTAGLGYEIWNDRILKYQRMTGIPDCRSGLKALLKSPLIAHPGERWEYSIGIDWVGQVIEAVSGDSAEAYFQKNLCIPLGLASTTFLPGIDAYRTRLAAVYQRTESGNWEVAQVEDPLSPEILATGHGLFSTTSDYARVLAAMANGGALGKTRILQTGTVDQMFQNHIGDLYVGSLRSAIPAFSNDFEMLPGRAKKHGIGFIINVDDIPGMRPEGSAGWAGIFNSYYWVDPRNGIAGTFMTQTLPFADEGALALFEEFEKHVYRLV